MALKGHIPWNKGLKGVQKYSKKTREKISEAHKGYKFSENAKKKMSKSAKKRIEKYPYTKPNFTGYKHSNKTKKKMRIVMRGRHNSIKTEFKNGCIVWNKGLVEIQKCSEETKKKMRKIAKKKGYGKWMIGKKLSEATCRKISEGHKGEKSHFWKGGITKLNNQIRSCFEYRLWRKTIFERDNWTCQRCNSKGCYLHAHHIKNFSIIIKKYNIKFLREAIDCFELWDINNGITLCKKCHKTKHSKLKVI